MATGGTQPYPFDILVPAGDAVGLTFTFLDSGVTAHAWTGQTVAMAIYASSGALASVAAFTTATPVAGSLTVALTSAQVTTLGVGTFRYTLVVTTAGLPATWMAGQFTISQTGYGQTFTQGSSFSINPSGTTISVALTVAANTASAVTFTPTGTIASTNVQTAIAEVATEALLITRSNGLGYLPTTAPAIAQSYPRWAATTTSVAQSTGQQTAQLVWLPTGTINAITFVSGTVAAIAPTNQWFSIYDLSRNKLAVTNDDTNTAWAANTAKTLTIAGGYTVATEGYYYVGIMVAAGTPNNLFGTSTGAGANTLAPQMCGRDTVNTGLTTPATAPATLGAFANPSQTMYCYVS